jgi:hypothetical protein
VAGSEPGDRNRAPAEPRGRRLAEAPSARYAAGGPAGAPGASRSALPGALARAGLIGIAGAAALVLVGGVFASTFGLVFVSGIMGAAIGLVIARAAVPRDAARPTPRRTLLWIAFAMAIGAVVLGDVGLWLFARQEGGTLGPLDYLWTTFGPFVPGDAIVAALAAWWGASAGPVQR